MTPSLWKDFSEGEGWAALRQYLLDVAQRIEDQGKAAMWAGPVDEMDAAKMRIAVINMRDLADLDAKDFDNFYKEPE